MKHKFRLTSALLLPMTLLAGCASSLTPLPVEPVIVTRQATLPPLPASAMQPSRPSACLPTCVENLQRELLSERDLLMQHMPQD